MTPIYFLDGLGSNCYYVKRLEKELLKQGFELRYLPLPGHPENLDYHVENLSDLTRWFESQTPKSPFMLMGFSLGADFAAYLSNLSSYVTKLILLDGGFMDFETFGYSLEQELADTEDYLISETFSDLGEKLRKEQEGTSYWGEDLEKAVRYAYVNEENHYRLNLNSEIIFNLLKMRRDCQFVISKPEFSVPTLMILSDTPEEFLAFKQGQVEKIQNDCVMSHVISETGHQLYLEKPTEISQLISTYLQLK